MWVTDDTCVPEATELQLTEKGTTWQLRIPPIGNYVIVFDSASVVFLYLNSAAAAAFLYLYSAAAAFLYLYSAAAAFLYLYNAAAAFLYLYSAVAAFLYLYSAEFTYELVYLHLKSRRGMFILTKELW